jgi:hypothetical protein
MKQDNFGLRAQHRLDDDADRIDGVIGVVCLAIALIGFLGGFL